MIFYYHPILGLQYYSIEPIMLIEYLSDIDISLEKIMSLAMELGVVLTDSSIVTSYEEYNYIYSNV